MAVSAGIIVRKASDKEQIMSGISDKLAIENFQFGDIILTRNNSLNGRVNAAYQKLRRNRYLTDTVKSYAFIPTHAALVLSNTEVIQSNKRSSLTKDTEKASLLNRQSVQFFAHTRRNGLRQALRQVEYREMLNLTRLLLGQGVDIDTEFFQTLVPSDTLVIRHPTLANNLDLSTMLKIHRSAYYHLGKPYNTLIEVSDGQGITAFCSQLIYTIFNDAGLEMPSQQAYQVLPIDFLIWAITSNWQVITHEQVRSLLLQHKQYLDACPPVNFRTVELHEAVVEKIQKTQNNIQAITEFEQYVADLVQSNKGVVLPPRLYKAFDIKPEPTSVEQIILAGDNFYRYLTGCEPRNVNTPSEAEDKAFVFSTLDALEVEKLSWLLETETSADTKNATFDPQLFISKQIIKTAEVLLADFDLALKEAIAHVNTQSDTSDIALLQRSGKTSDINEPLEILWFIAELFERGKGKEDIEKRSGSASEDLKVLGKQLLDELQGLGKVSEASAQESEQLAQSIKAYMAGVVRYHAYACAYDFLRICRGLAMLDEILAGSSFTLSGLYELNPQAFLEFLTTMDTPQKMWDITLSYINNLPLSIKQYWDNI